MGKARDVTCPAAPLATAAQRRAWRRRAAFGRSAGFGFFATGDAFAAGVNGNWLLGPFTQPGGAAIPPGDYILKAWLDANADAHEIRITVM